MKIQCIAVDDEPLALKLLQDNISKVPYLNLVASCRNAFETMQAMQEHMADLLFIDIQMPGLSGLQYISTLERKPLVIFITAYKQFALESYDLSVVDYLVKPVPLERFIRACHKARDLFELQSLKQLSKGPSTQEFFFVNADYSQVRVQFNDIIYMEGLRDYVKFHLKSSSKPLIVRGSLKVFETELPSERFIRVHKSFLVGLDSILAIRKNSIFIGEKEIPIGETFKGDVEKLLKRRN